MLRLALRFQEQIRYFPMPDREVQLGAAMENDLVAPFPGISRHHAKLSPEGGAVRVTDLGSTNGLVRDGRRLDEILLTAGKAVCLGHAILTLEDLASSDGETGLRFQVSEGQGLGDPRATDTSMLPLAGGSSPAAALRFVRELERAGVIDPAEHLGRARRSLGAVSLLILATEALGDPAVIACEGPLPSEPDSTAGEALVADVAGGARLIAHFGGVPEPWQRDFFSYLGEKLLHAVSLPSQGSSNPPDDLCLPPGMIAGTSAAMRDLLAQLRATARSDLSVLLTGETGTGKELFARLIHQSGGRSGLFIAVNCAAIPAELLEAELFGIAGRVATGVDPRPGLFVQANGGTLFLDEIGDMPESLQAKLLRALQEREVLPLGGSSARKIDARIVAASNRDLGQRVKEGRFRGDLYYRLRGLELRLPPLRERSEDLPSLLLAFASRSAAKYGKRIHGVSRRALSALLAYDWPGNIRELESMVERAVLLCPDGGTLQREHLGALERGDELAPSPPALPGPDLSEPAGTLQEQIDALERAAILRALAAAKGNKSKAAGLLGITRNGLSLKMDRLKISRLR